jgi:hypothetical protein
MINIVDILCSFEYDQTYSVVVGELCGCVKDRKEAHGDEMEGIQGISEVTILFHQTQIGTNHEVEVPSSRTRKRSATIMSSGGKPSC